MATPAEVAATASTNSRTSQRLRRRLRCWCSKKSMPRRGPVRGQPGQKATWGAARFSSDSISRNSAGWNVNMLATTLLGKFSRAVL